MNTFKIQHREKKKYLNKRRVYVTKKEYEGREVKQLLSGRKPKRVGVPLPRAFSAERLLDTTVPKIIWGSNPKKQRRGQLEKVTFIVPACGVYLIKILSLINIY